MYTRWCWGHNGVNNHCDLFLGVFFFNSYWVIAPYTCIASPNNQKSTQSKIRANILTHMSTQCEQDQILDFQHRPFVPANYVLHHLLIFFSRSYIVSGQFFHVSLEPMPRKIGVVLSCSSTPEIAFTVLVQNNCSSPEGD